MSQPATLADAAALAHDIESRLNQVLIGQQQVVVKNLEDNYRKVPGVSAATILGDGSVALILDITGLHRLSRAKKEAGKAANQPYLSYYKEAEPS